MLNATGVSSGIGYAQVMLWHPPLPDSKVPRSTKQPELELQRFEKAHASLLRKNDSVRQKTARRFGDSEAAIFDAYAMMLGDEEGLINPVRGDILDFHHTAESAVTERFNTLAQQFLEMESEYLRQRAEDIYSLRDQLLREMLGIPSADASHLDEPTVIVAHTLSPADIASMDLSRLEGIVCETGGYSSHTAIICRTLGVPAVVGAVGIANTLHNGDMLGLDGDTGEVWHNPGKRDIALLRERASSALHKKQVAQLYRGLPTITTDGYRLELGATIGQLAEIDLALESDAESIGMLRTEMIHVNRMPMASEEEQFLTFQQTLERVSGKSVVARTFDDGGNRPVLPIKGSLDEINPVLGYRGIRMSLGRQNFFRTQLRALLRASAYGDLKIMLPMVSVPSELDAALEILESVKMELKREGVQFDEKMPVGAMIEVPAAALNAEYFAQKVDFFTIDANDLLQFLLAVDRTNPQLTYLYHQYHPSLLRLYNYVAEQAHAAGIPCYICGETAGQENILPVLLGMGMDGISVNPSLVLHARRVLNSCSQLECYRLTKQVLELTTSEEVRAATTRFVQEHVYRQGL